MQTVKKEMRSILLLKLQIALCESWKPCSNLCSRRWLKASLNLVSNSTPLGSWQLKALLPKDVQTLRGLFLKVFKLSELRMFRPSLFHSMTVEGKKELWIKLCSTLNWEMLLVFLVFYLFTVTGMLKRYFGEWKLYRSSVVSGTIFLFKGIPNLAHYKVSL